MGNSTWSLQDLDEAPTSAFGQSCSAILGSGQACTLVNSHVNTTPWLGLSTKKSFQNTETQIMLQHMEAIKLEQKEEITSEHYAAQLSFPQPLFKYLCNLKFCLCYIICVFRANREKKKNTDQATSPATKKCKLRVRIITTLYENALECTNAPLRICFCQMIRTPAQARPGSTAGSTRSSTPAQHCITFAPGQPRSTCACHLASR